MELNKTTAESSLYNCSNNRSARESRPEPRDSRDVKTFTLAQTSSQNKHTNKTSSSRGSDVRDEKKMEEGPASITSKEERKEEQEGGFLFEGAPTMAMVDIMASQAAEVKVDVVAVSASQATVDWVEAVIAKTIESMIVQDVEGKQLVDVILSNQAEVPEAFFGSNMVMVKEGEEISVKFSNFSDVAQAQEAVELVASSPEKLLTLIQNLGDRQLVLKEMVIGNQVIQLPTREENQSPLQVLAAAIRQRGDSDQDKNGRDQDKKRDHEREESEKIQQVQL